MPTAVDQQEVTDQLGYQVRRGSRSSWRRWIAPTRTPAGRC